MRLAEWRLGALPSQPIGGRGRAAREAGSGRLPGAASPEVRCARPGGERAGGRRARRAALRGLKGPGGSKRPRGSVLCPAPPWGSPGRALTSPGLRWLPPSARWLREKPLPGRGGGFGAGRGLPASPLFVRARSVPAGPVLEVNRGTRGCFSCLCSHGKSQVRTRAGEFMCRWKAASIKLRFYSAHAEILQDEFPCLRETRRFFLKPYRPTLFLIQSFQRDRETDFPLFSRARKM